MAVRMLVRATVLALKDYGLLAGVPALKDDDYLALLQAEDRSVRFFVLCLQTES